MTETVWNFEIRISVRSNGQPGMRQAKKVGLLNKIMKLEPGQVESGLEWKKRRFAVDFVTTSFNIAKLNKSGLDRPDGHKDIGANFNMLSPYTIEHLVSSQGLSAS